MPYTPFLSLVVAALSVSTAGLACANNNLFLPGDAFFPTVLTKSDIEALQAAKDGDRTFKYSSFDGYPLALCGFAGYNQASIRSVDDAFVGNLATVYKQIRTYQPRSLVEEVREGKDTLVETNGMRVLFYQADYPFPDRPLGLRYNENWIAETARFGFPRNHVRLCGLVEDASAVEMEWRDAGVVPPLKATVPDVKITPIPGITEGPVVVEGPVKAVVIGSHTLKYLFDCDGASEVSTSIHIVDSRGITEFEFDYGNWHPRDPEEPADDDDSKANENSGMPPGRNW